MWNSFEIKKGLEMEGKVGGLQEVWALLLRSSKKYLNVRSSHFHNVKSFLTKNNVTLILLIVDLGFLVT